MALPYPGARRLGNDAPLPDREKIAYILIFHCHFPAAKIKKAADLA